MKRQRNPSFMLILTSLTMLIALVGGTWSTVYGAAIVQGNLPLLSPVNFVVPTIQIVSVQTDQTVTIQTANFPANDTFNVLMNVIHTQGIGGINVGTFNSGVGGTLTGTFTIPASLKGQQQIAIRLESPTSGFFSYNWFWNNTTGTTGGIPNTGGTLPPGVIPTFSITGVTTDVSVSIQTANFPANNTFNVLMGVIGTRGIGGINVGTFSSGAGGTLTGTFNIPASLRGADRIAIRLESPTSGFFSYNWFFNNTAP